MIINLSRDLLNFIANLIAIPGDLLGIFIENIIVYYRLISKGHSLERAFKIYSRMTNIRAISAVRDFCGDRNISMRDAMLKFSSKSV